MREGGRRTVVERSVGGQIRTRGNYATAFLNENIVDICQYNTIIAKIP